jgi:DNA-3-methyladenine glycosylase II
MKEAIEHLKRADPVLSAIIDRVGEYRIEFRSPDFETLVKSIIYQQLSGRVASVIFARLAKAAGGKITPATVLKLRPSRMRTLGLS